MAGDRSEEVEGIDPETGFPQPKKSSWGRRVLTALFILLILLSGAGLGAALVFTGVLPVLGAGVLAIAVAAVVGAVAFGVFAAIIYGVYRLISFRLADNSQGLEEEDDPLLDKDTPKLSDSDDPDNDHGNNHDEDHSAQRTLNTSSYSGMDLDKEEVEPISYDNQFSAAPRTLTHRLSDSDTPLLQSEMNEPEDAELFSSSPDFKPLSSIMDISSDLSSDDRSDDVARSESISPSSPGSSSSYPSSSSSSSSSDGETPQVPFSLFESRRPPLVRSRAEPKLSVPVAISRENRQQLTESFGISATEACNEQIVKTLIGENSFRQYEKKDLTEIQPVRSSQLLLEQIEHRMQVLEQLKHPEPLWSYSRLDPTRPGEKVIIKIEHTEGLELDSRIIADKKRFSLATRKLSVIGGVLSLLDSRDFLSADGDKKQKIRDYLTSLSNEVLADAKRGRGLNDVNRAMNAFVANLNDEIASIVGVNDEKTINEKIVDPIREAERYFVAEHNQNKVLVVITRCRDGSKIIQIDNSLNHELTDAQKIEYMAIHDSNPPLWFTRLHPAEQQWYRERVPEDLGAAGWADFEKLFKSSAMQHTPGLANARVNYLITQSNDGVFQVESASLKTATPVTYEMQKADRERQTQLNIEQEIATLQKIADHNFNRIWGGFFEEAKPPQRPILIQSLLSGSVPVLFEVAVVDMADQHLISAQREGFQQARASQINPNYLVLYHNNPTNAYRHKQGREAKAQARADIVNLQNIGMNFLAMVVATKGPETISQPAQAAFNLLINTRNELSKKQMETLHALIDDLALTDQQGLSLRVLVNVENRFRTLGSSMRIGSDRRNKQEYIIALKKMYVEAMGGAAKNNCKSGKDRTGQSEVYQHALSLETKKHHGEIIAYDETGPRRDQFCERAGLLISSMKIQEAAAFNTPGSVGTKTQLATDIIDPKMLKKINRLHSIGCDLAGSNKCDIHKNSEKRKMDAVIAGDQSPPELQTRRVEQRQSAGQIPVN